MTRWGQVEQLFEQAACLPATDRDAFLDRVCRGDSELRAEVASLLIHDAQADAPFLEPAIAAPPLEIEVAEGGGGTLLGKTVGECELLRVLGSGGMGVVYEAQQRRPLRRVAVKVLARLAWSRSARRRFEFETQILARLTHANIAQIHAAGTYERNPYFVMEFVANALEITNYAVTHELTIKQRLDLMLHVCDAVQYGHQKGIIHRDLKPGNILVDGEGLIKIIDFGIARSTDSDVATTTLRTDSGQLLGTLQYMSPEQCEADPLGLDVRSDVYSLGVVLYELLCGELPYDVTKTTIVQAARVICEQPPTRPSAVARTVRGDLELILLRALEKDRRERYRSADDLARDIRHYLNREPVEAGPPSIRKRVATWIIRHPVATSMVSSAVVVLLMLSSGVLTSWLAFQEPYKVVVTPDHRMVQLLSWAGKPLDEISCSDDFAIPFASFLRPRASTGGRALAIVGFSRYADAMWAWRLCAFDVGDGTFGDPLWQDRVRSSEVPPANRPGFSGGDFDPQVLLGNWDIFPNCRGAELVVAFAHRFSRRSLRIYGLDGEVLYEAWHDGHIESAEWLKNPGLLVLSGDNAEVYWEGRGVKGLDNAHPSVVFAIRPEFGRRHRAYIRSEQSAESVEAVWYKGVLPPQASDLFEMPRVRPQVPKEFRDGYHFTVGMRYRADARFAFNWVVNSAGEVVSADQDDAYSRDSTLPSLESFRLDTLPPILSGSK